MGGDRRITEDEPVRLPGDDSQKAAGDALRDDAYNRAGNEKDAQKPGDKAADVKAAPDKPVEETERERTARLQQTLERILPAVNADLVEKVKKEREQGQFGPATKQAYEETIKWLRSNITDTLATLDKQGLPIPPGCPVPLPTDKSGLPVIDAYYRGLIHARRLSPEFNTDSQKIPTSLDIDKMANAAVWISDAMTSLSTTSRKFETEQMVQIIEKFNRPGWLPPKDASEADMQRWYAAAAPMVDLSMKMRNYAEAISSLNLAGGNFPKDGIDPKNFPGTITFDKNGKILDIKLDLPEDLRQTPENMAKIKRFNDWLAKYSKPVDQALEEYVKAASDQNRLLIWGDLDASGKVKLDANGKVVPEAMKEKTPGTEKDFNLLECRFDVETLPDGRIKVKNSTQYQYSHWYNYLDIGADDIGKKVEGEERIYNPYDFVPVVNGGKIEIMRADKLADWKASEKRWHYGEKAATIALDVGMLVTGTIEVGAAVKAARAGELALRVAVGQSLKGMFRVSLGASGLLNNANTRSTDLGRTFLHARGFVMLADVTYGLGKGALGWFRGAKAVESVASTASVMEKTVKGMSWAVRAADKTSKAGFLMADCVYVPVISKQIMGQIDTLRDKDQKPRLDDAVNQRGGGMGNQRLERNANETPEAKLEASKNVLSGYAQTMDIKDSAAKGRVETMIKGTQDALALPEGNAQRKEQKDKLVEQFRTAATEEEKLAAATGLLYLSRNADGSLPEVVATVKSVDATTKKEVSEQIKSADVIAQLEKQVETSKSAPNRMVAGEMLVRLGRISGQQYAGILQDILKDPNSSKELKMRAMVDDNGPRLGAILDAVRAAERQGLTGTTEEKFAQLGQSYGLSASDLEKTLLSVAGNAKEDADVRAMAVSIVHALNRDSQVERNEMLQRCNNTLKEMNGKPAGSFSQAFVTQMKTDLAAQADVLDGNADQVMGHRFMAAAALTMLTPDAATDAQINKSLVDSVNQSNADLALQAVSYLLPERIKKLSAEDAKLVRGEVMKIFAQQTGDANVETKLAIMKVAKPLFEGAAADQQQAFVASLQSMISSGDVNYQGANPDLRKAAIAALADLGSQASIAAIQNRLRAENEPSAMVRVAAVDALEKMKAPGLKRTAMELIQIETDPAVAARLRDVKAGGNDPNPDSADYKEAYRKAKQDLLAANNKSLANSPDFITKNFPLLDGEGFRHEAWKRGNDIYDHFGGGAHLLWDIVTEWDTDIRDKKYKAADEAVINEMKGQMNAMIALAKGNGPQSEDARKALTYMVISNGRPALDGWRDWAVGQAASGLYQVCQKDAAGRDKVGWAVETALMNQPKMDRGARGTLLNALTWLVNEQPPVVGRDEAARAVAASLELEYRAMPKQGEPGFDQSKALQLTMIEHLKGYNNPKVLPMLEAMVEEHPIAEVKAAAQKLAAQYKADLKVDGNVDEKTKVAAILASRPDLTAEKYKDEFERAKADLIKSTSRSTEKSQDWIRSNYRLLNGEAFRAEQQARADEIYGHLGGNAHYLWDAVTNWDTDIDDKKWKEAREAVAKECRDQFDAMISHAKGNGNGSDEARKALVEIVHTNGRPFMEADRDWAVNKASMALYELCKPGAPGRGDVVWAVETTLMNQPNVSRKAKWNLLVGLDWLASGNPPAIGKDEAANVLAAALEKEYSLMPKAGEAGFEDSKKLQMEMIRQIGNLQAKKVYPVLEAIIDNHPMPEVKTAAEDLLASMRDRVSPMVAETKADTVTPVEQRAEAIAQALKTKDVNETCQAIFSACKGTRIQGADDPRAPMLHTALQDSSEKVRLAAAWVLLESSNPADVEAAIAAIADLSVTAQRLGSRREAESLIAAVKKWGQGYERMMTAKLDAAKARKKTK